MFSKHTVPPKSIWTPNKT